MLETLFFVAEPINLIYLIPGFKYIYQIYCITGWNFTQKFIDFMQNKPMFYCRNFIFLSSEFYLHALTCVTWEWHRDGKIMILSETGRRRWGGESNLRWLCGVRWWDSNALSECYGLFIQQSAHHVWFCASCILYHTFGWISDTHTKKTLRISR